MEILAQIIFWGSVLGLAHTYLFYPLLMRALALGKQPNQVRFAPDDPELPAVSVLMSVYNEERVIARKLESLKALNYPGDKMRIYIGSDCSNDRTETVIRDFITQNPGLDIRFHPFSQRRGKPPVINDLAHLALESGKAHGSDRAQNHVFLLTDASVMLEPDTLYRLVRHFKNSRIGVVDAHMRGTGLREEGISRSEARYLDGEVRLKHHESLAWGMMIGPFGGCYALRASLFEPVPPNSLVDDFWLVFRVLEKGYAAVNDLEAICYEGATHRVADEYRRKKRIAAGSFQNLSRFRRWVLPPFTRLGFAFFSHKVLRWFGGFFLLAVALSLMTLAGVNHFYRSVFWLLFAAAVIVLTLNFLQNQLKTKPFTLVKNLAYFAAMNIALIDGFFKWLRGIRGNTWQRTTRE
ncbi:MAG: glycosyltransferase [Thermoanaerobaculia bacterium]|nr:glycosyltransferase [Thermoanaerobaculia bacterium]